MYLSIKLSDSIDPTTIIDLNLRHVINSTKAQFECWQAFSLSWLGLVTGIKNENFSEIYFCIPELDPSNITECAVWDSVRI